jgi:DNA ligase-1
MNIYETLLKIQNTPGSNDKKAILKTNMSPILQHIFLDTYGSQNYYVKKFECPQGCGESTIDNDYMMFHKVLEDLSSRTVTGDAARAHLFNTVALFDKESQEILCRIIDRNLKVGISLDNFLDVIGMKATKFEVALAENIKDAKNVNPIDGTYFISRKLDGVRCICYVSKSDYVGSVDFISRQGKPITTLDKLTQAVMQFVDPLPNGSYVLDGEICIMDKDGNENFHGLMKEVTRKNHTIENPRYNVFDILTRDEFDGKEVSLPFSSRLNLLNVLEISNDNASIKVLEQELVTTQEIFDDWTTRAKENGWEGCMLRKDVPYKRGRSKELLKIKGMQDAEYEVVGVETGKATYNEGGHKEFDVASALYIKHKDNIVKVGSGLSKEQRLRWFDHPEEIIGKTITVQYFEETQDSKTKAYSLRFPVLKYVYEDGRNV